MKPLFILIILLFVLPFGVFSQKRSADIAKDTPVRTPKEAVVEINFLDFPGKLNEKSVWELGYELRIIDGKSLDTAIRAGELKEMSLTGKKLGSFIANGSFKKDKLSQIENRKVVLKIPFGEEIQEKLANNKKVKQHFLFYSSAIIFDGKLKKNVIIPLSWVWRYDIYPDANFGMDFKIKEADGNSYSYSTNTFLPEKLTEDFYTTSNP